MIDYAINWYEIIKENCIVSNIQDFDWNKFSNSVNIIAGWWNLCYLPDDDINKYLEGAKIALSKKGP